MQEVYEFLKKCRTYYLATVENGEARVRPFGTIDLFRDGLYIQTGKVKKVSAQMHADPHIEICAFDGEQWLRLRAEVEEDSDIEAQRHMLAAYPELSGLYKAGDGNTEVFRLKNATAVFSSFTAPDRTSKF